MTILVNGRPVTGPRNVAQAVALALAESGRARNAARRSPAARPEDNAARGGIAVAVNGEVVPRSAWAGHALRDGDRVEILTAAQGG
jgi:thiamine biosynthesis protein ThiS